MKALAEVEIRCGEHDHFEPGCSVCCFLKTAEHNLQALRTRRGSLLQQIKQRLGSRELIIIDLR